MNIVSNLENILKILESSSKEKILCISTTANINNPEVFFGSMRETETTIAGNVILRSLEFLPEIIDFFDGKISYFFVDCEIKNEVKDLEKETRKLVKKSNIFVYKPNDFTIDSLDMFISLLFPTLFQKKIFIVGVGNVGSKISLALSERGGNVYLFGHDIERTKIIKDGLNNIYKNNSIIVSSEIPENIDLILGCTPGTESVTEEMVHKISKDGKIIDVGNGTITKECIKAAREKGIEILVLSSTPGYQGMITNWLAQREYFTKTREKKFSTSRIIVPGVFGNLGDVLVDNVDNPKSIIGVCNGRGDILPRNEGNRYIEETIKNIEDISLKAKFESLYK